MLMLTNLNIAIVSRKSYSITVSIGTVLFNL